MKHFLYLLTTIILLSCNNQNQTDNTADEFINYNTDSLKAETIKSFLSDYDNRYKGAESFPIDVIIKGYDNFGEADVVQYWFPNHIMFSKDLNMAQSARGWGDINYKCSFNGDSLTLINISNNEKTIYYVQKKEYGLLALNYNAKNIKPFTTNRHESGKNGFEDGEIGFIIPNATLYIEQKEEYNKLVNNDKKEILSFIQ